MARFWKKQRRGAQPLHSVPLGANDLQLWRVAGLFKLDLERTLAVLATALASYLGRYHGATQHAAVCIMFAGAVQRAWNALGGAAPLEVRGYAKDKRMLESVDNGKLVVSINGREHIVLYACVADDALLRQIKAVGERVKESGVFEPLHGDGDDESMSSVTPVSTPSRRASQQSSADPCDDDKADDLIASLLAPPHQNKSLAPPAEPFSGSYQALPKAAINEDGNDQQWRAFRAWQRQQEQQAVAVNDLPPPLHEHVKDNSVPLPDPFPSNPPDDMLPPFGGAFRGDVPATTDKDGGSDDDDDDDSDDDDGEDSSYEAPDKRCKATSSRVLNEKPAASSKTHRRQRRRDAKQKV